MQNTLTENLPAILYKYCHPDRIDILVNNTIRFTPASEVNDLLEMKPNVYLDPAQRENAWEKIKKSNPSVVLPTLAANSPHEEQVLFWSALESSHVLSLAENWDNPLMWSYYCSSHKGFVLGLDVSNRDLFLDEPLQVNYSSTRPCLHFGDNAPRNVFATKAEYWKHEREWRSVRVNEYAPPLWLVPFAADAIKEVVIGDRASQMFKMLLMCCLRESRYAHVKTYQAHPRTDDWTIGRSKLGLK